MKSFLHLGIRLENPIITSVPTKAFVYKACFMAVLVLLQACANTPSGTHNTKSADVTSNTPAIVDTSRQSKASSTNDTNEELGPYERVPSGSSVVGDSETVKPRPETTDITPAPSVVSFDNYKDPFIAINRPIFKFNDVTYKYLLSPLSAGYQRVVPKPIDRSVFNFFKNLREPLFSINHLLQGNVKKSGASLVRFVTNSTVGVVGLFDASKRFLGVERHETTLSDTLSIYGVGYGAYIVLPLLGPSDARNTSTLVFNYLAHPLNHINDEDAGQLLLIFDGFHGQVPTLADYPRVVKDVQDPYTFVRNLYLQGTLRDDKTLKQTHKKHIKKSEQNLSVSHRKESKE